MTAYETYLKWKDKALEDPDLVQELNALDPDVQSEIDDRFGCQLVFGTGGLRGVLGTGTNRMNIYTVRRATQALAEELLSKSGAKSVVIAYDSRIKSQLFAAEAARVLAGNQITAHLFPWLTPTPVLSFAVRHLGCDAGICITASHNPAQYNGYKVYGPDGCQITQRAAEAIEKRLQGLDPFEGAKPADFVAALQKGLIRYIGKELAEAYFAAVKSQSVFAADNLPLQVVYTPLNGAGLEYISRLLKESGIQVNVVPEQEQPDGRFPTCPKPNPEEPAALQLGLALCEKTKADLLLATDPDCDRVGVAAKDGDGYRILTGNEVGVLLLDFIGSQRQQKGIMPNSPIAIKTIVTTDLAKPVANAYGIELWEVLTGFKYIGEQIGLLEQKGQAERFVFGFEESCGYLSGGYVRDKDAVNAVLLVCEMARFYKQKGQTLAERMQEIYRQYGYYRNRLLSFDLQGLEGQTRVQQLMQRLRTQPPATLGDLAVEQVTDYINGICGSDGRPDLPPSNVLELRLTGGAKVVARPSGTEPKMKLYLSAVAESAGLAEEILDRLEQDCSGWF